MPTNGVVNNAGILRDVIFHKTGSFHNLERTTDVFT